MKPKQLVSTGKVIWIEANGESSSPIRFVIDEDKLYFLRNGRHERVPPIRNGQKVKVIGHPLAKQTRSGEAEAIVTFVSPDDLPQSVLLELAGTYYDPRLSPDENCTRLASILQVARLDLT
ncbi:MAG: hypothetical protein C4318_09020 [Acidimicrobiia bacterium]